jgi:hypothetical protein
VKTLYFPVLQKQQLLFKQLKKLNSTINIEPPPFCFFSLISVLRVNFSFHFVFRYFDEIPLVLSANSEQSYTLVAGEENVSICVVFF